MNLKFILAEYQKAESIFLQIPHRGVDDQSRFTLDCFSPTAKTITSLCSISCPSKLSHLPKVKSSFRWFLCQQLIALCRMLTLIQSCQKLWRMVAILLALTLIAQH